MDIHEELRHFTAKTNALMRELSKILRQFREIYEIATQPTDTNEQELLSLGMLVLADAFNESTKKIHEEIYEICRKVTHVNTQWNQNDEPKQIKKWPLQNAISNKYEFNKANESLFRLKLLTEWKKNKNKKKMKKNCMNVEWMSE